MPDFEDLVLPTPECLGQIPAWPTNDWPTIAGTAMEILPQACIKQYMGIIILKKHKTVVEG